MFDIAMQELYLLAQLEPVVHIINEYLTWRVRSALRRSGRDGMALAWWLEREQFYIDIAESLRPSS